MCIRISGYDAIHLVGHARHSRHRCFRPYFRTCLFQFLFLSFRGDKHFLDSCERQAREPPDGEEDVARARVCFDRYSCVSYERCLERTSGFDLAPGSAPPGVRGLEFQKALFEAGLHIKMTGDSGIVAPPLISDREHVDQIVEILRKTLSKF